MAIAPAESLGRFLESVRRVSARKQKQARPNPFKLLLVLTGTRPKLLSDAYAESGMGFAEFVDALQMMADENLIVFTGEPGEEALTLTPRGARVAEQLAA